MKLAVLIGSSRIDQSFLDHALDSGYDIRLLGLQVPQLNARRGLELISGSVSVPHLEKLVAGTQAVVALPHAIESLQALGDVVQTMHACGVKRLVVAADLYQREPQAFETLLQKAAIDWTLIHYEQQQTPLKLSDEQFGKYLVGQITDVTHVRLAVMAAP